jgi:hypothetical protein
MLRSSTNCGVWTSQLPLANESNRALPHRGEVAHESLKILLQKKRCYLMYSASGLFVSVPFLCWTEALGET